MLSLVSFTVVCIVVQCAGHTHVVLGQLHSAAGLEEEDGLRAQVMRWQQASNELTAGPYKHVQTLHILVVQKLVKRKPATNHHVPQRSRRIHIVKSAPRFFITAVDYRTLTNITKYARRFAF